MTTEQCHSSDMLVMDKPVASPPSPLSGAAPKPFLKIRPPGRWSPLALGEMLQYGDLFLALAVRDVKVRYKQTALGVIWVILQPLMGAGIFTFVFGFLAKVDSGALPFIVFSYAGMLGWQAFNGTLVKASECIVGNAQLVSKVFFPRLILPLSTVLSTLLDFSVGLLVMAAMMAWFHVVPGLGILMLPVVLALLVLLAVGVGLFTSALMVTYRDLRHAMPVFIQFLLYASPIGYPLSLVEDKVPEPWRTLYFLNPLVELLQVFRWSLLNQGEVQWGWFAYSAGAVVALFVMGAFAFKRMERRFADVI